MLSKNNLNPPVLPLYLFIKFYMLLRYVGITRLPKIKGLFVYLYNKLPNKWGVMKIVTTGHDTLYIDLADQVISSKLVQYGHWEEGLTSFVSKTIRPGMTVVDIGAHAGYYSVMFSRLVGFGGRVFSFEPESYNFSLLKKNIEANNISHCVIENLAVSNISGILKLYLDADNLGGHSAIDLGISSNSVNVRCVSLDDYFQNISGSIDFIKMDIEGSEGVALQGAEHILKKNPRMFIIVEFNPMCIYMSKKDPMSFLGKIRSYGFNIGIIDHKSGDVRSYKNNLDIMRVCGKGLVNLLCSPVEII